MPQTRLSHDWFSRPLPDNVQTGERSWIYSSHAFFHYGSKSITGVSVGADTGIYHGTFFDLGPGAEVVIGEFCSIVGAIFSTDGRVTVGDYTFIAHEVVIGDSHWARPHVTPVAGETPNPLPSRSRVEIGSKVWIGAQAAVVGNVRIGEGAIIGAGALVTQDVPAYTLCAGNPMRIVRPVR